MRYHKGDVLEGARAPPLQIAHLADAGSADKTAAHAVVVDNTFLHNFLGVSAAWDP